MTSQSSLNNNNNDIEAGEDLELANLVVKKNGPGRPKGSSNNKKRNVQNKNAKATRDAQVPNSNSKRKRSSGSLQNTNNNKNNNKRPKKNGSKNDVTTNFQENL